MRTLPTGTPTSRDIRLDYISMTEWRVCDRRFDENDSRCVLGFIERNDDGYEVMALRGRTGISTYGSLASATSSFSDN